MRPPLPLSSSMLVFAWLASGCHLVFPFDSVPQSDAPLVVPDSGPRERGQADAPALDRGDAGQLPGSDAGRAWKTVHAPDAGTVGPGRLYSAVAIYHEKRQSVVIYGGTDHMGVEQAVMWEYTSTGWSKLCAACLPGPRTGHGMVYDSQKERVLLYGGVKDADVPNAPALGDLWVWEDLTLTPTLIATTGSKPGPLVEMFMAYDSARGVTVLFGGRDAQSTAAAVLHDGVFELDGYYWSGPLPNDPTAIRPAPRYSYAHSMTFVPAAASVSPTLQNRLVLCGGSGPMKALYDDCWTWDGKAWHLLCGPATGGCTGAPRLAPALVYDLLKRRLLMMGGWTVTTGGEQGELDGTWASANGAAWSALDPVMPPARDTMAVAYRLVDDAILVHGGNGSLCKTIDGKWPWDSNCGETYLYVVQP